MFRTLINDAKSAAGSVIGKYAIRVSVAVPFLVAAGFATAAGTLLLIERFGAITAYVIMAGGFAAVGLIASAVVAVKEQEGVATDTKAEATDTADVATDAAAQAAVQLPIALLGTLLTTPMGPGLAAGSAKALVRNLPLVILVALIGLLFWPSAPDSSQADAAAADAGSDDQATPAPAAPEAPLRNGEDHRHAA